MTDWEKSKFITQGGWLKPQNTDRGSIVSKENVPGPGAYLLTHAD